jgi:hypothetical protein
MRFSLGALFRLLALGALGSFILAVEVSRFAGGGIPTRAARRSSLASIPGQAFARHDDNTRLLDVETGAVQTLPLPTGEYFDNSACSPWQDANGVSLVAGRRRRDTGTDGDEVLSDMALACYTVPEGKQVGVVACDRLPAGGICWYPDALHRVLFATADGTLFHVSFETDDSRGADLTAGDEGSPVPLRWEVDYPREGAVMMRDPYWPTARGFERTVIVSMRYLADPEADHAYSSAQLWWLRLNPAGTAVVAAGRLTEQGDDHSDEFVPSLAETPSGLAVAYMSNQKMPKRYELRIAPVALDPKSGTPRADARLSVVVVEGCAKVTPLFSTTGRFVSTVVHPQQPTAHVQAFAVSRLLAPTPDRGSAESH